MKESEFTPLGVLEEQILVAVVRTRGEAYGMQVRREIERVTGRDLAIGAVYATLDRLEAKGFVASKRVPDDGGSRRMFEVTGEGARMLTETHAMRQLLWRGVDLQRLRLLGGA
jgi:PadR family transcriptional regulator